MNKDFCKTNDYKNIFSFHASIPLRIVSRESTWLEFKESFNWGSRDKYAKSMAAFANNKGGYIIFGIKDKPRDLVFLQTDNFETIDEAKITAYLNSVFSPEIIYEKFLVAIQSKNIGILHIHQSKVKPVVCVKNDGDLREADIYYRYNARSEKIKYAQLQMLFEQVKQEERKSWMEHFEKISKIGPTNTAIFDTIGGEISGHGGTLVIDKKLISKLKFINQGNFQEGGKPVLRLVGDVKPVSVVVSGSNKKITGSVGVHLTDDPTAPAFRLEEEGILQKRYPLDYTALTSTAIGRYSNFLRNSQFFELLKKLKKDESLCRTRYLDPSNSKSSKKDFYSFLIFKELDKKYQKK